jgi:predicted RNA-binding Zn-ribbon protein involved in translation (DUF1610 family)
MPDNVKFVDEFITYIKSKNTELFSQNEADNIYSIILNGRLADSADTDKKHINNVKRHLDNDAPRACPKCGAEMIKRTTKSGENAGQQFWGCSTFPKCRIMQKMV